MKKLIGITLCLLLTCLCTFALADVAINETNFPDATFRDVVKEYDTDQNNVLSDEEIAAVTGMNIGGEAITTLKGIEVFTSLRWLQCPYIPITELDMSGNINLKKLECFGISKLTKLDVTKNTELEYLACDKTPLNNPDLSHNTKLTELDIYDCWELTTLDISNNTELTDLCVRATPLTSLNISKNTKLKGLQAWQTNIKTLDVSQCPALVSYVANNERIEEYSFGYSYTYDHFTSDYSFDLKVDAATKVIAGNIVSEHADKGVAINETSFPDDHFREFVKNFDTDGNNYLEDEEIAAVTEMDCSEMGIYSLEGIEYFTQLSTLNCNGNQITTLDMSKNTMLTELFCGSNQLTSLDVSKNPALVLLSCPTNQMTSLDVSKNTSLERLSCYSNKLTNLDVSKNTGLKWLRCHINQLTGLDVSKNTVLESLSCYSNNLTSLDISKCSKLVKIVKDVQPSALTFGGTQYYGWCDNPSADFPDVYLFIDKGVKVITSSTVPVAKITLNKTKASLSITLSKKGTVTLKATVSPKTATNKDVKWTTSNKKVATVNSKGKVTAVGSGTCTITCTAKDGSKKKATCKITVTVDEVKDLDLKYSLNHEKKTATVTGPLKKTIRQATVSDTVKANGKTYKVTIIAAKAFKGLKKLVTFNTGKYLTTIGASAFEDCTNLNTIGIQSKNISKIGASAFKNISKKTRVYMSSDLTRSYIKKLVKLLKAGGIVRFTQIFE